MSGLIAHFLFAVNFEPGTAGNPRNGRNWIIAEVKTALEEAAQEQMAVSLEAIRSAAERVAASHGLDVVDIEFTGPAKDRLLRVFLEKNAEGRARLKAEIANGGATEAIGLPGRLIEGALNGENGSSGGLALDQLSCITHEDCTAFSRDFGVLLDVEDLVPGAEYTLEASSPGLDRKLSKPGDFLRFVGCLVKVQTCEPVRNNRHWQGRLTAAAQSESGSGSRAGNSITLDLAAVRQNSKSRKAGVSTVEIALGNIEKANLVPEI
jgi:ribosome maturation factor RimP